jgi:hypothetical protein
LVIAQQKDTQIHPKLINGTDIETIRDSLYNQAYLEMADMLDDKIPLSIKRAIFLHKWAYLDGELDYEEYCLGIDTVANYLRKFIEVHGLYQYKTGGNYALFEYCSHPYSIFWQWVQAIYIRL